MEGLVVVLSLPVLLPDNYGTRSVLVVLRLLSFVFGAQPKTSRQSTRDTE